MRTIARKTISHAGQAIEIIPAGESIEVRCLPGDLYVLQDKQRPIYWVGYWDGREAWDDNTPCSTLREAIKAAKEWAEQQEQSK